MILLHGTIDRKGASECGKRWMEAHAVQSRFFYDDYGNSDGEVSLPNPIVISIVISILIIHY